ncbi:hypothetical protein D9M73_259720 [compost metagenome]
MPSCSTPTSAEAPAATLNCRLPINAEALPACWPCFASAQAAELGMRKPRLAMQPNSGSSSGHSSAGWLRLTASSAAAQAR